ncbi:MAG TPA: serine hydrolase domain-containing protein [Parvularculaceae bacterium]|nr:serine hydrolase domain-containing protein [Parvularculaceae bacterium]
MTVHMSSRENAALLNRRRFLTACSSLLALSPEAMAADDAIAAAVRSAIEAGACPAVQVALARDGRTQYSRGFGLADIENRTRLRRNGVFRIGSLSKQFTAAAAIKLASDQQLDLDAPISTWLPFMAPLPVTTPLELMHQTSGLRSDETGEPLAGNPSQIDLAQAIASQEQPFDFPPGEAWLYSNANYIVLGAIIEAVTQKPLAEALHDLVFAPAGLRRTRMDGDGVVAPHRVTGYSYNEQGEFVTAAPMAIAQAGGAGALLSTADELCQWHRALLGGHLFGASYVELMTAPGRLRDGRLSGANRFAPEDASYGEVQYACGLLVSPPDDANPSLLHFGYIDGFSSMLQTYTRTQLTIAVLCNCDPGPDLPFRSVRAAALAGAL